MGSILRKFFELIDHDERRGFYRLLGIVILQGMAEAVATLAVMPFLRLAIAPEYSREQPILKGLRERLGDISDNQFVMLFGLGVLLTLVTANLINAYTVWRRTSYAYSLMTSISARLLRGYLLQPYSFYLGQNTSTLTKNLLSEVNELVSQFIYPLLTALAKGVPAIMIVISVILVDWRVMVVAGSVLGGAYLVIDLITRRQLDSLGEYRMKANEQRYRVVGEAFNSIKEVKLFGCEAHQIDRFLPSAAAFSNSKAKNLIVSQIPRYFLEILMLGGLVSFCLIYLAGGGHLADLAPQLALFALAAYRVLPSMQEVFKGSTALRFNDAALNNLVSQIRLNVQAERHAPDMDRSDARLALTDSLVLRGIQFRYAGPQTFGLHGLNLRISAREAVGIVGRSGAGKSTLADIILGLLQPQSGDMEVDGQKITNATIRAWQRSVGYVPQSINLIDASIAENIAFGLPKERIDLVRVEEVARIANLHDFILANLPERYATRVGEKGAKLSGGQRQRIGIARALYRNPSLLVFDEATSALDPETERAVMEAIENLSGRLTMILIAHRHSTLEFCDRVFWLDNGVVHAEGPPAELLKAFNAAAA